MWAGTHSRSETSTDKWKNESQRTSGKTNRNGQMEKRIATENGKTNRNGQVEKRIATNKCKNESQRTSGKTNGNGQVEKRVATDKWKNESQQTSGKTNRNKILTSSFTGRFANWTSTLTICP